MSHYDFQHVLMLTRVSVLRECEQQFQVFGELETEFTVICMTFTIKASGLPVDIQCDVDLTYM